MTAPQPGMNPDFVADWRTVADACRAHAIRVDAMADRLEHYRRTGQWSYPWEPGYASSLGALRSAAMREARR